MLTAQAREATIVTSTQCQATTASRNARVTRCLKQDPTRLYKDATSSLPDATSSLKRRTCECSFREKALLVCWSTQRRWSSATQTGVVQPDVYSPLDTGRTTTTVVPYHQHESLLKSVLKSLNSLVQQKSGAEQYNRSAPNRKAEYALHLLPTYTHAVNSGSWMQ